MKLIEEQDRLTDKLIEVTKKNTSLMANIASLTKSKLEIGRELNHARIESTGDAKLVELADQQDRDRIALFAKTQEKEIALLKNELYMLKRKDSSQSLPYLPLAPGKSTSFLPPIPTAEGIQTTKKVMSKTMPLKK